MPVDDFLYDRQADAQAAAFAITARIGAPEALEDHTCLVGRQSDAGIAHGYLGHGLSALHAHEYFPALVGIAHRVGDEVGRGLADEVGVAHDVDALLGPVMQRQARFRYVSLMRGDDARHDLTHVYQLVLVRVGAVFQARELQQRIHQARQPHDLGINRHQALLVNWQHAVDHGLNRSLDGHERRAKLVRHIGRQAPFKLTVALDRSRHGVEGLSELGNLVLALHVGTRRKIALLERHRCIGQRLDGPHQRACEEEADQRG